MSEKPSGNQSEKSIQAESIDNELEKMLTEGIDKELERKLKSLRAAETNAGNRIMELTIQREQAEDEVAKLTKEIAELRGEFRRALTGYDGTKPQKLQDRIDARQKKLEWATARIQGTQELIEEQENKKAETAAQIKDLEAQNFMRMFRHIGDELINKPGEKLAKGQALMMALHERYVRAGGDRELLVKSLFLHAFQGFIGSWRCIPQFRLPQDRQEPEFRAKTRYGWNGYWPEDVRPFYQDHTRYGDQNPLRAIGKYDSKTYIPKED